MNCCGGTSARLSASTMLDNWSCGTPLTCEAAATTSGIATSDSKSFALSAAACCDAASASTKTNAILLNMRTPPSCPQTVQVAALLDVEIADAATIPAHGGRGNATVA